MDGYIMRTLNIDQMNMESVLDEELFETIYRQSLWIIGITLSINSPNLINHAP